MIPANPAAIVQYPEPPYDLTDQEADEWNAIVRSKSPDHFDRGNFPMLAQLCRHIIGSRRVAQLIQACVGAPMLDRKEYFALSQMQSTESAAIMKLSRSMRLTQQTVMPRDSAKLKPRMLTKAPWDRNQSNDDED